MRVCIYTHTVYVCIYTSAHTQCMCVYIHLSSRAHTMCVCMYTHLLRVDEINHPLAQLLYPYVCVHTGTIYVHTRIPLCIFTHTQAFAPEQRQGGARPALTRAAAAAAWERRQVCMYPPPHMTCILLLICRERRQVCMYMYYVCICIVCNYRYVCIC